MDPIEIANFWTRVTAGRSNECWEWQGRTNHRGYGRYGNTMAHRVAYALVNGPIPEGLIVRHSCDNPPCCNPRHLLAGTHKDNTQDALDRGRFALGERHGMTRLADADVALILENPEGLRNIDLARQYEVNPSTISLIRRGLRRAHT